MKSFSDWMKQNNPGNYVSVDVDDLPLHLVSSDDGSINSKPHVTLMYSKGSGVPPEQVQSIMNKHNISGSKANIHSVSVFPDSSSENKSAIVLELHHPELNKMHDVLSSLGCKHSFAPFKPHATLVYGVDNDNVDDIVKRITPEVIGKELTMGDIHSECVNENWVDSLNNK